MDSGRAKLDAGLAECVLHAQVLGDAAAALPEVFSAEMAATVDADRRGCSDRLAGASRNVREAQALPMRSVSPSITSVITETSP